MKAQTRTEANTIKKQLQAADRFNIKTIQVFKFATKRKFQFFVGTWWEWMAQIS